MPDLLQAVRNMFQSVADDEPKQPLHIGEAMSCWLYVTMLAEAIIFAQACLNTTSDPDVKRSLPEAFDMRQNHINTIREFMQHEGVPLPPISEPKPESDPAAVPLGVKLTDDEIANGVSVKFLSAMIHCATSAGQSIRTDVGIMFIRFQLEMMTYGTNLKVLMKQRGWIKYPPHYQPPGSPVQ